MPLNQLIENRVLTIEISRPEKRNTLDAAAMDEFVSILAQAEADPGVRAVLVTGKPGIFCAGGDLSEQLAAPSASDDSAAGRFVAALEAFSKPLAACVEGPCVGLGTTLLYYCDIVYAGASSLFSLPYTALGLTPRFGVTSLAVSAAGLKKAAEKILLSEPINAQEALQMGIVSTVLDEDVVRAQALTRLQRLAKLPPQAVADTKRLLRAAARGETFEAVRALEAAAFEKAAASPEAREACAAFLEGRKPNFD